MMGGGTQLILDNVDKPYIEIIDNKIISNDGIEEWDISNDIPNTDPEIVGEVYTWGNTADGRLGFGYTTTYAQFTPVKLYNTVWRKLVGFRHTLGIDEHNDLWGWGWNERGQLGLGYTGVTQYACTKLASETKWKNVACGEHCSFAQDTNGEWYGWGCNNKGQLGRDFATSVQVTIIKLNHLTKWKQVFNVNTATFAITDSGELWGWGECGTMIQSGIHPKIVPNLICKKFTNSQTHVSGTFYAISDKDELWAWGNNDHHQLGYPGPDSFTPINIAYGTKWKDIGGSEFNSYAIDENNQLYAWGHNHEGTLGLGYSGISQYIPVKVMRGLTLVQCSRPGVFALSESGYWYAWGNNVLGELGVGVSDTRIMRPYRLETTLWDKLFTNDEHTYGLIKRK